MPFEKYPGHGMVIAAGAIENGYKVLECQDSFGLQWGDQGPSLDTKLSKMMSAQFLREEDIETFATNTIRLARRVSVSVMIKLPPSYQEWNFATQGTYISSVTDLCRMPFEKDPSHGLVITAGAIENGLEVLECQDSFGLQWGAQRFIKIAFYKYLIKEVFEFTV
ncbi:hypothetical protein ARALYDRAFT_920266 [Arabidopsis lyrata subsp. lyrata]|uniref:Peptidase C1A papain C-terminal domain-containing protein n=1 Tax=Arabidopsis lyrata subsp. lyrata TaxID=81972 RepID=D7MWN3_ARALL|nr:hypothetical protein ARALYDRAFT_920266 [Arabidopsis lyrata subsp. lyrata]